MDKLDQARVQQSHFATEANRLREELNLARQRDQQALGRALAAAEPEPDPEAAAIEAEIERNTRRAAAMGGDRRRRPRYLRPTHPPERTV
jgi:hypothetical protein